METVNGKSAMKDEREFVVQQPQRVHNSSSRGLAARLLLPSICSSAGFTLIEIMVVIIILGILVGLIVPRLMEEPEKNKDVLEIYYLCLSLGFEGKYKLGNASERNVVIDSLARLLLKAGRHSVTSLSPHGRRTMAKDLFKRGGRKVFPLWAVCTTGVVLLLIFYGIMHYLSNESLQRVLSVIK